ncbi:hypothetical protein JXA85_00895 [Candidatus Woesearchaeota archaeon]|nr:hypothetical protein [Candidatus Woesearchaeota archaeon]
MGELTNKVKLTNEIKDNESVEKNFGKEFIEGDKTFLDLIIYALKIEGDELNQGYNNEETIRADTLADCLAQYKNISLKGKDNRSNEKVPLEMNYKVADYANQLFQEKMMKDATTGTERPFKLIELYINGGGSSGIRMVYRSVR